MSHRLPKRWLAVLLALLFVAAPAAAEDDTLPAMEEGRVAETIDEIWRGFDPRREPLEVRLLKEWRQDDVVCRIVQYRVGVFKGVKSWVGGLYAFPRNAAKLPGLIQVHGGGQSANLNAALTNARRGYACLSLNWGGNQLNDGDYRKLWDSSLAEWGAVDGTHPPQRDPINHFAALTPNEFTLDEVESPRNSAWLLAAIAVRRGLTFLEQQPEVDGDKLGVYGHSMGGKLTVVVAATDPRVKAAVPSCGGVGDYPSERLWENSKHLQRVRCPILFLNPVNDFYGKADELGQVTAGLPTDVFRFSCSANLDHRDRPEHFACGPLWFDQHLKSAAALPKTPLCDLLLDAPGGVPVLRVAPDPSRPVKAVDLYYTQQLRDAKISNPCWRYVAAEKSGDIWSAALPLLSLDRPLRAYANVRYALDAPVSGAGYYYGLYTAHEFVLSSRIVTAEPEVLKQAGVQATDRPSLLIEAFEPDWRKGWYVFQESGDWPYRTNKLQDPKWQAPVGAKLAIEVRSQAPNRLVVRLDDYAAALNLAGGESWQSFVLAEGEFKNALGQPLDNWRSVRELVLSFQESLNKNGQAVSIGGPWNGPLPCFRNLRWEASGP